jgi:glycosyltransferase involved in cell wall biosynthesis
MKLTIAIPTYNRAKRLEKSLLDLCAEINRSYSKSHIEVFVRNNGSTDDTADVISRCGKLFHDNLIPFKTIDAKTNQGFDANVIACYAASNAEYVWFLSDDDNIISGAIDVIIRDIDKHHPSVIFYNHDQEPYDRNNPLIKIPEYFDEITHENFRSLQKIINFPKLTSLVIKICDAGKQVINHESGFAHLVLAFQCGLSLGGMLHSPVFTAFPDADYKDNINFVPYIGNKIKTPVQWALKFNKKMDLYEKLTMPNVDPFISSLNTLSAYYRGKHVLTLPLKLELWETVQREVKFNWFNRLRSWESVKEFFKFPISIAYSFLYALITGKKLQKDR